MDIIFRQNEAAGEIFNSGSVPWLISYPKCCFCLLFFELGTHSGYPGATGGSPRSKHYVSLNVLFVSSSMSLVSSFHGSVCAPVSSTSGLWGFTVSGFQLGFDSAALLIFGFQISELLAVFWFGQVVGSWVGSRAFWV